MKQRIGAALLLLAGLPACAPVAADPMAGGKGASAAPRSSVDAGQGSDAPRSGDRLVEPGFIPGVTPRTGPLGGPGG